MPDTDPRTGTPPPDIDAPGGRSEADEAERLAWLEYRRAVGYYDDPEGDDDTASRR